MKAIRLLPALLAAALCTSFATSYIPVLDPGGASYMDGVTLHALPTQLVLIAQSEPAKYEMSKGGRTPVYARVTDLGLPLTGARDLSSDLQLAGVDAPEGVTVKLDSVKYLANFDTPTFQANDMVELVFFASTNGRVANGTYRAKLTLRSVTTGRVADVMARVIVTDPSQ